ncbi:hypothetical protein [Legionella sp. WA2022007384]
MLMLTWFATLPFLHLINFSTCSGQMVRFEKETRYYELHLQQDLLKDWIIVAINGRKQSKLGQSRTIAFPNYEEAFDRFCTMIKMRYQRGYCVTAYFSKPNFIYLLSISTITELPTSSTKRHKSLIIKQRPQLSTNPLGHPTQQQISFFF